MTTTVPAQEVQVTEPLPDSGVPGRRPRRRPRAAEAEDRHILSAADWRRPRVRITTNVLHVILLILLVLVGLFPLLWLFAGFGVMAVAEIVARGCAMREELDEVV